MNKYIVIEDHSPDGGLFCLGVFEDIDKAFGVALRNIWDFKESYKEEDGDIFTYTSPYMMEGDGGYAIKVDYKASSWENEETKYYYILFGDEL